MTIREMRPDEARQVQWLGSKVFLRTLEGFAIPKPKTALVAEKDGKIAGAVVYSTGGSGGKKFGSIDFLIVESAYAGQGIGSALCRESAARLWDEGCDFLATSVRDDNVGSWACFEKIGFVRASVPAVAKTLGLSGFLKLYLGKLHGFNVDCDFYFAVRPAKTDDTSSNASIRPDSVSWRKKPGAGQMLLHVFINVLLFFAASSIGVLVSPQFWQHRLELVLSSAAVLISVMLFGFLGTLVSGRKWHYRTVSGGVIISIIMAVLGSIFLPVFGGWYPNKYENTPEFRRDMGISALLPWLFLMGTLMAVRFAGIHLYGLTHLLGILLIFRCIPMPHVNFGMMRIFRWNKIICAAMIIATVGMVFFHG